MPMADYGEKVDFSTSKFIKLKAKGDKIQFRLIGAPFYDGKHFFTDAEGNWDIQPCPRINGDGECDSCELFFKAHAEAKKDGLDKKATEKLTKKWRSSVSFYFPVIDRDSEEFKVFQTTIGVRNSIETEKDLGVKIMDRDFVVLRTEKPGGYYKLSVVDSAETKKLTKEEKAEFEKGKATDLSEYVRGREEDGALAQEANSEEIKV